MPGESYHAPHAPLRQRLSVGGGPSQVCTLPFFIQSILELSFHKMFQVQYETDETVVSGEERRGGPYKTATIIG